IITIGFNEAKCEIFDKYRRRPRSHFIQCGKCFKLNYFAKDARTQKYASIVEKEITHHRNNPRFQKCVLCNIVSCDPKNKKCDRCELISKKKEQVKINSSKNPKDFKEKSKVQRCYNKNQVNGRRYSYTQNKDQSEEIKQLKNQIALSQATVQQLSSIVQAFIPSSNKQMDQEEIQDNTDIEDN
ncbi:hypothetical protein RFI_35334, partial [Reticulomyxa filosa]